MDYETVLVERRGGELRITLNRPEAMNAWNKQFGLDLRDAVENAAEDDEVRAVVITGAGRGFCVGQDLTEFREAPGDIGDRLRRGYHPNIRALRALEKPVLAAVNGRRAALARSTSVKQRARNLSPQRSSDFAIRSMLVRSEPMPRIIDIPPCRRSRWGGEPAKLVEG